MIIYLIKGKYIFNSHEQTLYIAAMFRVDADILHFIPKEENKAEYWRSAVLLAVTVQRWAASLVLPLLLLKLWITSPNINPPWLSLGDFVKLREDLWKQKSYFNPGNPFLSCIISSIVSQNYNNITIVLKGINDATPYLAQRCVFVLRYWESW